MVYLLLVVIGLAAAVVYVLVVFREVPGAVDERLGTLEDLPSALGEWNADETSRDGLEARGQGLIREERIFLDAGGGRFGSDRLLYQVRYRDAETGRIERVEPDQTYRRRRVRRG